MWCCIYTTPLTKIFNQISKAKTILLKFLNVLDSLLEYKSSPDYYCYGESHQSVVDLIHAFDWKNVFSIT